MAKSSTISATIFEAKTHLSELVKKAHAGKTVIITSGREKKPVAKIEAIQPFEPQRLGFRETPGFVLPDSFWDPLPPEWTGEIDDPDDPLYQRDNPLKK
jgi:antitoxin (DNA-binding transcriptional repressor) of toxin-antitoxin stability system